MLKHQEDDTAHEREKATHGHLGVAQNETVGVTQVLVHVATYQGSILVITAFLSHSHLGPGMLINPNPRNVVPSGCWQIASNSSFLSCDRGLKPFSFPRFCWFKEPNRWFGGWVASYTLEPGVPMNPNHQSTNPKRQLVASELSVV